MTSVEHDHPGLLHDAFVYGSDAEYADVLAPLLAEAVDAGDHVVSVVPSGKAVLLHDALGATAAGVTWIDADDWYRHPVRTIASYDATLRVLPAGMPAFVVGEVRFGGTADEWAAWTRYEAALNRSLDRHEAWVVCPYDTRELPASVVDDAARTHPTLVDGNGRRPSGRYANPEWLLGELAPPIVAPLHAPDLEIVRVHSIRDGRRAFAAIVAASGFDGERVHELTVAISEVLTNAIVHAGSAASLRVWVDDRSLQCVVDDDGPGNVDPLLGLQPPRPGAVGSYGLWLTRQVFDSVTFGPSPTGGLRVLLVADR
jgi:anti-sigma regulatory factor (Ser/Thr protein kinase)